MANDSGGGKNAEVHVRLSEDEKEKWQAHADEYYGGKLSKMVREAARSEVSEDWMLKSQFEQESEGVEVSGDMEDELTSIKTQLRDLAESVSTLVDEDEEEALSKEELNSIASAVQDWLPKVQSEDDLVPLEDDAGIRDTYEKLWFPDEEGALTREDYVSASGLPEVYADYLDRPESHIRDALDHLETNVSTVESTIEDGIRRWYEVRIQTDH